MNVNKGLTTAWKIISSRSWGRLWGFWTESSEPTSKDSSGNSRLAQYIKLLRRFKSSLRKSPSSTNKLPSIAEVLNLWLRSEGCPPVILSWPINRWNGRFWEVESFDRKDQWFFKKLSQKIQKGKKISPPGSGTFQVHPENIRSWGRIRLFSGQLGKRERLKIN